MRIITYSTTDEVADPRNRFHARVLESRYAPETAPGRDGFAPVYFRGATAAEAQERAQAYIDERERVEASAKEKRDAAKALATRRKMDIVGEAI